MENTDTTAPAEGGNAQPAEPAGSEQAVQDSPMTARDLVDETKRKIQLEGAKDPANFKMPGGRTLADVQKDVADAQAAEGRATDAANQARVRELGRQSAKKPEDVRVGVNKTGQILTADKPEKAPADANTDKETT